MELIDDWRNTKPIQPEPGQGSQAPSRPVSPDAIESELDGFEPEILSVHCYEDLGYPWVHVVFRDVIHPDDALRVGDALAAVAGEDRVYLNSLRPMAVFFVLATPITGKPELPVTRYGAPLGDIKAGWQRPAGKAAPRSRPKRRPR